ncbi:hypothetical protein Tsubulata_002020 [Turnera subulata]|uniref:Uncharacterized protein n=1 Tax=Turnera subulata TaxID=218843 RepID=A0A9Q0FKU9_9ROSI|nr:hypothetical protein Tsubulata_002020 [Turnera subulata]
MEGWERRVAERDEVDEGGDAFLTSAMTASRTDQKRRGREKRERSSVSWAGQWLGLVSATAAEGGDGGRKQSRRLDGEVAPLFSGGLDDGGATRERGRGEEERSGLGRKKNGVEGERDVWWVSGERKKGKEKRDEKERKEMWGRRLVGKSEEGEENLRGGRVEGDVGEAAGLGKVRSTTLLDPPPPSVLFLADPCESASQVPQLKSQAAGTTTWISSCHRSKFKSSSSSSSVGPIFPMGEPRLWGFEVKPSLPDEHERRTTLDELKPIAIADCISALVSFPLPSFVWVVGLTWLGCVLFPGSVVVAVLTSWLLMVDSGDKVRVVAVLNRRLWQFSGSRQNRNVSRLFRDGFKPGHGAKSPLPATEGGNQDEEEECSHSNKKVKANNGLARAREADGQSGESGGGSPIIMERRKFSYKEKVVGFNSPMPEFVMDDGDFVLDSESDSDSGDEDDETCPVFRLSRSQKKRLRVPWR